jgi:hypothetical protein
VATPPPVSTPCGKSPKETRAVPDQFMTAAFATPAVPSARSAVAIKANSLRMTGTLFRRWAGREPGRRATEPGPKPRLGMPQERRQDQESADAWTWRPLPSPTSLDESTARSQAPNGRGFSTGYPTERVGSPDRQRCVSAVWDCVTCLWELSGRPALAVRRLRSRYSVGAALAPSGGQAHRAVRPPLLTRRVAPPRYQFRRPESLRFRARRFSGVGNDREQPPEQCCARRARIYGRIRLRPRSASPAAPEHSSSGRPGSGMKRITRITNDPFFSLEPRGEFVRIWFGVTSRS